MPRWNSWGEKLDDHAAIRSDLIRASLLLSAFEIFRSALNTAISSLYRDLARSHRGEPGFHDPLRLHLSDYRTDVLELDQDRFRASCLWLLRRGGITDGTLEALDAIRMYRNEVAHELPRFLMDPDSTVSTTHVRVLEETLRRIEDWWFTNVELTAYCDFCNEDDRKDYDLGSLLIFTVRELLDQLTGAPQDQTTPD